MGILEAGKAGEARAAADQPLDGDAGEGPGAGNERRIVRRAGNRPVEAGDHALQRVLRRVEEIVRLAAVLHRFALARQRRTEIGGEGEGGDIGGGGKQRLELVRLVACQGRGEIARLQAFEIGLAGKGIRHRQGDLKTTAGAEEHGMLLRREQRIGGAHGLDGPCQLHLARAPRAGGRDRRHETPAGAGKRGALSAVVAFEDDEFGDEALRRRLVLGDIVFVDRRQSGIEAHRSQSF